MEGVGITTERDIWLYMNNKKVKEEHKRLYDLLERAEVPQQKQEALAPVIDNMAWLRVKLDEARKEMQDASIICEYNNGGGQTGVRENPIFKAYVNLYRAYMVGFEKFSSYLPKDLQEEAAEGVIDMLAKVKTMKEGKG